MNFLFSSKSELSELLPGMVDMHNHLLPGIDDGAKSLEESIAMLKAYQHLGIRQVIASPHVMEGNYPNTPKTIAEALAKVQKAIQQEGLEVQLIGAGAEYMLEQQFERLVQQDILCSLDHKHLLVEMSYLQAPLNLEQLIFQVKHKGYTPVLAHPERYNFIKEPGAFKNLLDLGCQFQLNLLSLSQHYGAHVQQKAFRLLKDGSYRFVGTDAHHVKHLEKIGKITLKEKYSRLLRPLFQENKEVFGV
ncbi:tyrosine-protein phosphatase [Mesonia aquimarina]|uniref:tyrosine-protein phosphatase n=1 Tax=Mesonia aquimarina TaxID=1504967 RepID=UPI000EF5E65F|nr:CpsB/CapC family capsule biosynthesis tyrosine phosphatase [Mesonia aquimarina]